MQLSCEAWRMALRLVWAVCLLSVLLLGLSAYGQEGGGGLLAADSLRTTARLVVSSDSATHREGALETSLRKPHGGILSRGKWYRFCDSLTPGQVALASMVLPGVGQVINREYWKLPIFYGGMAGFAYVGYGFHARYLGARHRLSIDGGLSLAAEARDYGLRRNLAFTMAGLFYACSVADAAIAHAEPYHSPVGAMVASMLFPGLGQVYNGSYWKVPVLYGLLGFLADQMVYNHRLYKRFEKSIVAMLDNDASTVDEWEGKRSIEELTYFEESYHRTRDLYAIGLGVLYALNIVDAYVDAHLFYWNVNDDLSLRVAPDLVPQWHVPGATAVAMRLSVTF